MRIKSVALVGALWVMAGWGPPDKADEAALPEKRSLTLGLGVGVIDDTLREAWKAEGVPPPKKAKGLVVIDVLVGSPAEEAGINVGDILSVKVKGDHVRKAAAFREWLGTLKKGKANRLRYWRTHRTKSGKWTWKKYSGVAIAAKREVVYRNALRYGYYRISDQWMELPEFDLSKPSSQTGTFRPSRQRVYRKRGGGITTIRGNGRPPPGSVNITRKVAARERRAWEATLPRISVGEHGIISAYEIEIVQILGKGSMIVDLGSTTVLLSGFNTSGSADGKYVNIVEPIAVISTWAYTTVTGARRTIFAAVPIEHIKRGLSEGEITELEDHLRRTGQLDKYSLFL